MDGWLGRRTKGENQGGKKNTVTLLMVMGWLWVG
jgi:hypothetical protein